MANGLSTITVQPNDTPLRHGYNKDEIFCQLRPWWLCQLQSWESAAMARWYRAIVHNSVPYLVKRIQDDTASFTMKCWSVAVLVVLALVSVVISDIYGRLRLLQPCESAAMMRGYQVQLCSITGQGYSRRYGFIDDEVLVCCGVGSAGSGLGGPQRRLQSTRVQARKLS